MEKWIVDEKYRDLAADRYFSGNKPHYVKPVEAVIYHYTVSKSDTGTRKVLTDDDDRFVSVHFCVERDGDVWQMVPLDERAAHAGGKTSKLWDGKGNVNGRTWGIEIVNLGPILQKDGKLVDVYGRAFDGAGVSAQHKHPKWKDWTMWEAYNPQQVDALVELTKKLVGLHPILGAEPEKRLIGHDDVDPTRKCDPGPHFPWTIIRQAAADALK